MTFIYILKLIDNKYYVGKTTNPKFRLDTHFNSYGSAWTAKYKPIKVLEIVKNCDDYDEDKYTLKYMEKYGINNVRGGSFCEIKLTNENKNTIEKMIVSSTDKCYICGIKGHYASKCINNDDGIEYLNVLKRDFIKENSKKKYSYCEDSENNESWSCYYCGKEFDSYKGATFHENVHCKRRPSRFSSKKNYNHSYDHRDSEDESEDESEEKDYSSNKKLSNCYRCGRKGHYSSECYASKHVKGYFLS